MNDIPKSHPRYFSLKTREQIKNAMDQGLVHKTGLIAHGRGEAFDYLLGEKTNNFAEVSEKIATAAMLSAKNPVISINGNVAALVSKDIVKLSRIISAKLEVNLFHRSEERIKRIIDTLKIHGAKKVYGLAGDAAIPGLNHGRGICDSEGIFSSDVILVPLEDGDRCQALKSMDKMVITIDLNPISRTAKTADITIIDNVIRAIPNMIRYVDSFKKIDRKELMDMVSSWDNLLNLKKTLSFLSKRLNSLF